MTNHVTDVAGYSGTVILRATRILGAATAVLLCASACAFGEPPPDESGEPPDLPSPSQSSDSPDASVMSGIVAENLEVPWDIEFLNEETAIFTERDSAKIKQVTMPKDQEGTPEVEEVQVIEDAEPSGEGGLMGVAVSPEFESDETIYIYYTASQDNRIAKLKLGEDPDPIVTGIPKSGNHNGGQLDFGPDGALYASTGDASDKESAQDKDELAGKILRMDTDGEALDDNPFDDSLVYSYGHRNVQGLAWSENDQLFATEYGGDKADEINKIEAGGNYGWPKVEGNTDSDEYINPVVTFKPAEASCSGASFADSVLVTACLRGEKLYTVEFTEKGTVVGKPSESLSGELGRLRAVTEAPDGSLWVSTSNKDSRGEPRAGDDKIVRIIAGGSAEGAT